MITALSIWHGWMLVLFVSLFFLLYRILLPRCIPWLISHLLHRVISRAVCSKARVCLSIGEKLQIDWLWPWQWLSAPRQDQLSSAFHQRPLSFHLVRPTLRVVLPTVQQMVEELDERDRTMPTDYTYIDRLPLVGRVRSLSGSQCPSPSVSSKFTQSVAASQDLPSIIGNKIIWRVLRWILTCVEIHVSSIEMCIEEGDRSIEATIDGIHFEGSRFSPDGSIASVASTPTAATTDTMVDSTIAGGNGLGLKLGWLALNLRVDPIVVRWKDCLEPSSPNRFRHSGMSGFAPAYLANIHPIHLNVQFPMAAPIAATREAARIAIDSAIGRARVALRAQGAAFHLHTTDLADIERLIRTFESAATLSKGAKEQTTPAGLVINGLESPVTSMPAPDASSSAFRTPPPLLLHSFVSACSALCPSQVYIEWGKLQVSFSDEPRELVDQSLSGRVRGLSGTPIAEVSPSPSPSPQPPFTRAHRPSKFRACQLHLTLHDAGLSLIKSNLPAFLQPPPTIINPATGNPIVVDNRHPHHCVIDWTAHLKSILMWEGKSELTSVASANSSSPSESTDIGLFHTNGAPYLLRIIGSKAQCRFNSTLLQPMISQDSSLPVASSQPTVSYNFPLSSSPSVTGTNVTGTNVTLESCDTNCILGSVTDFSFLFTPVFSHVYELALAYQPVGDVLQHTTHWPGAAPFHTAHANGPTSPRPLRKTSAEERNETANTIQYMMQAFPISSVWQVLQRFHCQFELHSLNVGLAPDCTADGCKVKLVEFNVSKLCLRSPTPLLISVTTPQGTELSAKFENEMDAAAASSENSNSSASPIINRLPGFSTPMNVPPITVELSCSSLHLYCRSPSNPSSLCVPLVSIDSFRTSIELNATVQASAPLLDTRRHTGMSKGSVLAHRASQHHGRRVSHRGQLQRRASAALGAAVATSAFADSSPFSFGAAASSSPQPQVLDSTSLISSDWRCDWSFETHCASLSLCYADWINEVVKHVEATYIDPFSHIVTVMTSEVPLSPHSPREPDSPMTPELTRIREQLREEEMNQLLMNYYSSIPFVSIDATWNISAPIIAISLLAPQRALSQSESESAVSATDSSSTSAAIVPPSYHLLTLSLLQACLQPTVSWSRSMFHAPQILLSDLSGAEAIQIFTKHLPSFEQVQHTLSEVISEKHDAPPSQKAFLLDIGKIVVSRSLRHTSRSSPSRALIRTKPVGVRNRLHVAHATVAWDSQQHCSITYILVSIQHLERIIGNLSRVSSCPDRGHASPQASPSPFVPARAPRSSIFIPPHGHPHPQLMATVLEDGNHSSGDVNNTAMIVEEESDQSDADSRRKRSRSKRKERHGSNADDLINSGLSVPPSRKASMSVTPAASNLSNRNRSRGGSVDVNSLHGANHVEIEDGINSSQEDDDDDDNGETSQYDRSPSSSRSIPSSDDSDDINTFEAPASKRSSKRKPSHSNTKSKNTAASTTIEQSDGDPASHPNDVTSQSYTSSSETTETDSAEEEENEERSRGTEDGANDTAHEVSDDLDVLDVKVGPVAVELLFEEWIEKIVAGHKLALSQPHAITFFTEGVAFDTTNSGSREAHKCLEDAAYATSCPYPLYGSLGVSSLRFGAREILSFTSLRFGGKPKHPVGKEPDVALLFSHAHFHLGWDVEFGAHVEHCLQRWKALKLLKSNLCAAIPGPRTPNVDQPHPYPFPTAAGFDLSSLWLSAPGFVLSMDDSASSVRERHERFGRLSTKQQREEQQLRKRFEHEEEMPEQVAPTPILFSEQHKAFELQRAKEQEATGSLKSHNIGVTVESEDEAEAEEEKKHYRTTTAASRRSSRAIPNPGSAMTTPARRQQSFFQSPPMSAGSKSFSIPSGVDFGAHQSNHTPYRHSLFTSPGGRHPNLALASPSALRSNQKHRRFTSGSLGGSMDSPSVIQNLLDTPGNAPRKSSYTPSRGGSMLFDVKELQDAGVIGREATASSPMLAAPFSPPAPKAAPPESFPLIDSPSSTFDSILARAGASDASGWLSQCAPRRASSEGSPYCLECPPSSEAALDSLLHLSMDLKLSLLLRPDLLDPWRLRQKVKELDSTDRVPYDYRPDANSNQTSAPSISSAAAIPNISISTIEDEDRPLPPPSWLPSSTRSAPTPSPAPQTQPRSTDTFSQRPKGYFTELWARDLHLRCARVLIRLRDYPVPLLSTPELLLSGLIIPGNMDCPEPFLKRKRVQLNEGLLADNPQPGQETSLYGPSSMISNTGVSSLIVVDLPVPSRVPLKLYHDLTLELTVPHLTYGPCLLKALDSLSDCAGRMASPDDLGDPTPKLPWWDKMRYLLHGNFRIKMQECEIRLLANVQPYIPSFVHISASTAHIAFSNGACSTSMHDVTVSCVIHESEWNPISCGISYLPGMPNPVLWRQYAQGRLLFVPRLHLQLSFQWVCGLPSQHSSYAGASATTTKQHQLRGARDIHPPYSSQSHTYVHSQGFSGSSPGVPHSASQHHHPRGGAGLEPVIEIASPREEVDKAAKLKSAQSHYVHHEFVLSISDPHRVHRTPPFGPSKSDSATSSTTSTPASAIRPSEDRNKGMQQIHTVFDRFSAQDLDLKAALRLNPPNYPCPFCPASFAPMLDCDDPASGHQTQAAVRLPHHEETLICIPYLTARWWSVCWLQDMAQLYTSPPYWIVPTPKPLERSFGSVMHSIQLSVVIHAARLELLKQDVARTDGMSARNGMRDISGLLVCVGHFAFDASFLSKASPINPMQRELALQEPAFDILQGSAHILVPIAHDLTQGSQHAAVGGMNDDSFQAEVEAKAAAPATPATPNDQSPSVDIASAHKRNNEDALRRMSNMESMNRRMRRRVANEAEALVNFVDQNGNFISPFDKSMDGKVAVFLCSLRLLAFRSHYLEACANPWREPSADETNELTMQAAAMTKDVPFNMTVRLPPRETKWEDWFQDLMGLYDEEEEAEETARTNAAIAKSAASTAEAAAQAAAAAAAASPLPSAKREKGLPKALQRLGIVAEDLQVKDLGLSSARTSRSYSLSTTAVAAPMTTPARTRERGNSAITPASANTRSPLVSPTLSTRRANDLRHIRTNSVNALMDSMIAGKTANEVLEMINAPEEPPKSNAPSTSSVSSNPTVTVNIPTTPRAGASFMLASPVGKLPSIRSMPSNATPSTTSSSAPYAPAAAFLNVPPRSKVIKEYGVTRGRTAPAEKLLDYNTCSFRNIVVNLKVLWSSSIKTAVNNLSATVDAPHPSTTYRHILYGASPTETENAEYPIVGGSVGGATMNDSTDTLDSHDLRQRSFTIEEDAVNPLMAGPSSPMHRLQSTSMQLYQTPNGSFVMTPPGTYHTLSPQNMLSVPGTPRSPMLNSHHSPLHQSAVGIGKGIAFYPRIPYDMEQLMREVDANGTIEADDRVDSADSDSHSGNSGFHHHSASGLRRAPTRRERTTEWATLFELDCIRPQINFQNPISSSRLILSAARARLESHGLPVLFDIEQHLFQPGTSLDQCIVGSFGGVTVNGQGSLSSNLSPSVPAYTSGGSVSVYQQQQQYSSQLQPHIINRVSHSQTMFDVSNTQPLTALNQLHQQAASMQMRKTSAGSYSTNANQPAPTATAGVLSPPMPYPHRLSGGSFTLGPAAPGAANNSIVISPPGVNVFSNHNSLSQQNPYPHMRTLVRHRSSTSADSNPDAMSLDEILSPLYFEKKVFTTLLGAQSFVVPPDVDMANSLTWVGDSLVSAGSEVPETNPSVSATATSAPSTTVAHEEATLEVHSAGSNALPTVKALPYNRSQTSPFAARSASPLGHIVPGSVTLPSIPSLWSSTGAPNDQSFPLPASNRTVPIPGSPAGKHGNKNVLRRVVEPTTLHYAKNSQQDIDGELLRRGLGVLDDLNGIVARQSEVKSYQRNRVRAQSKAGAPNNMGERAGGKSKTAQRASLFDAGSAGVVQPEAFATDNMNEKRVLRDSIQLFLPSLEAHMDSGEFKTLMNVVQSVLLSLNDDKEGNGELDENGQPLWPIPATSSKADIASLQAVIEGVLEDSSNWSNNAADEGKPDGDSEGGSLANLKPRKLAGLLTPTKKDAGKTSNPPSTVKGLGPKTPVIVQSKIASVTSPTSSSSSAASTRNGPVIKSRVQYYLGNISWEMLKNEKGFISSSLQGMFGDHIFFHDQSVGIHAQIQEINLKSRLLLPGEKQHYHHLIRPDPLQWKERDIKRDMMVHIRALIREPLGDKNELLHYVTAYEHFELTFFPLVVCLPHDHALMLRDYFLPELDEEHAKIKRENEAKFAAMKKEREKQEKEKLAKEKEKKKADASASASQQQLVLHPSTTATDAGQDPPARLFNPKDAALLRPSRTQIAPQSNVMDAEALAAASSKDGALVPANDALEKHKAKLAAAAALIPAIKYFKYLRINAMDFNFSFRHESSSIFTFENVHLLVNPYVKSKRQYAHGWSELFTSIEKHIVYSVIGHGTEILAQKMGIGNASVNHNDSTRALLQASKDEWAAEPAKSSTASSAFNLPNPFTTRAKDNEIFDLERKKKEVTFGKKLLGIFSRSKKNATPEEQERQLRKDAEKREKERLKEEEKQRKRDAKNPTQIPQVGAAHHKFHSPQLHPASGLFVPDPPVVHPHGSSSSSTSSAGVNPANSTAPVPSRSLFHRESKDKTTPPGSSAFSFSMLGDSKKSPQSTFIASFQRRPHSPMSPNSNKHVPTLAKRGSIVARASSHSIGNEPSTGRSNSFSAAVGKSPGQNLLLVPSPADGNLHTITDSPYSNTRGLLPPPVMPTMESMTPTATTGRRRSLTVGGYHSMPAQPTYI